MSAAIELRSVSLVRRTQEELHYDLKRTVMHALSGRTRATRRRTVIDGLDLRVERGEKLGIIGSNGSGKSTLLKLIAGVLQPTTGQVSHTGVLAPLIEIGVGFDPDLTLVDNIIYYGVLLGHDEARVRDHVDAILEFAELDEIRDQPTKTLSSGMGARLGFAIATEFRPDILLLDEVLAVGDERFRRKCSARLERFWDAHSTIVLVSHDMHYVARTCDRVVWLDGGRTRFDGPAQLTVHRYLETVPATGTFRTGDELVALAAAQADGEIVVRGSRRDEMNAFVVRDGVRHRIASQDWYGRHGSTDVIRVDDAVLSEIPEGESIG